MTAPPRPEVVSTADLAGWHHVGEGTVEAAVEDGAVVYTATGGPGALVLDRVLRDVVVELEFALGPVPSDAGLLVRAAGGARPLEAVEVDVAIGADGVATTGDIVDLVHAAGVRRTPSRCDWHTLRVGGRRRADLRVVDGLHVSDWVELGTHAGPRLARGGPRGARAHTRAACRSGGSACSRAPERGAGACSG